MSQGTPIIGSPTGYLSQAMSLAGWAIRSGLRIIAMPQDRFSLSQPDMTELRDQAVASVQTALGAPQPESPVLDTPSDSPTDSPTDSPRQSDRKGGSDAEGTVQKKFNSYMGPYSTRQRYFVGRTGPAYGKISTNTDVRQLLDQAAGSIQAALSALAPRAARIDPAAFSALAPRAARIDPAAFSALVAPDTSSETSSQTEDEQEDQPVTSSVLTAPQLKVTEPGTPSGSSRKITIKGTVVDSSGSDDEDIIEFECKYPDGSERLIKLKLENINEVKSRISGMREPGPFSKKRGPIADDPDPFYRLQFSGRPPPKPELWDKSAPNQRPYRRHIAPLKYESPFKPSDTTSQ